MNIGIAKDGKEFTAESPEVIARHEQYPDETMEFSISSVVTEYENSVGLNVEPVEVVEESVEVFEEVLDEAADDVAEVANEASDDESSDSSEEVAVEETPAE